MRFAPFTLALAFLVGPGMGLAAQEWRSSHWTEGDATFDQRVEIAGGVLAVHLNGSLGTSTWRVALVDLEPPESGPSSTRVGLVCNNRAAALCMDVAHPGGAVGKAGELSLRFADANAARAALGALTAAIPPSSPSLAGAPPTHCALLARMGTGDGCRPARSGSEGFGVPGTEYVPVSRRPAPGGAAGPQESTPDVPDGDLARLLAAARDPSQVEAVLDLVRSMSPEARRRLLELLVDATPEGDPLRQRIKEIAEEEEDAPVEPRGTFEVGAPCVILDRRVDDKRGVFWVDGQCVPVPKVLVFPGEGSSTSDGRTIIPGRKEPGSRCIVQRPGQPDQEGVLDGALQCVAPGG